MREMAAVNNHHPFKSSGELSAFLQVYKCRQDRLPATTWIFESGDLYVLCGDDDVRMATECLPAANLRRYTHTVNDEDGSISFVTAHAAKNGRRLLQHILLGKHHRLEVYSLSEGKQYTKSSTASPCDLGDVKEIIFGEDEDGGIATGQMMSLGPICAVTVEGDAKEPRVGLCCWHEATKKTTLAEFYDNTAMDLLESLVIQTNCMEAVLPDQPKYRGAKTVLGRNKVLVTHANHRKSDLDKAEADILANLDKSSPCKDMKIAVKAMALLKHHLRLDSSLGANHVQPLDIDEFVRFNSQADAGINLMDSADSAISLFHVLHKTRTAGGERLLKVWLRQPLTSKQKIDERLDIVEKLVDDSGTRKALYESALRRIPDLESMSVKLEEKRASLADLYKCYVGCREARRVAEVLGKMESRLIDQTFVMPLAKHLEKLDKYVELVETTLDLDAVAADNSFLVKASFDNELMDMKAKLDKLKADIEGSVGKVASSIGLDKKSVKLEMTAAQQGYVFRVTMKDERALRKKASSEIRIVDTNKNGVRFRDKRLDQLNRSFVDVNNAYEEQQKYVVSEICEIASGYSSFASQVGSLISGLDCLVAFAIAAVTAPVPYTKPTIVPRDQGAIKLEEARHPCLELLDNMTFIPNSIEFTQEKRFCIITGPNLGGKSTFLRTVALNVLMAQVGSFVAASSATLFPVDRVLVRVGAGDSQLQGVSTFMAEMLEASHIVRSATRHSLVLIDELGRGTSTYDGLGLAWSISHHIANVIQSPTLFATHFHEVTKLASEIKSVFNCHVDAVANEEQFTLLYNVKPGSSDKSFGLEVARLAGFPTQVIDDAKEFLESAEMPLLRNTQGLHANDIQDFLQAFKDEANSDKKRRAEMLNDMKAKVAKVAS